MPTTSPQALTRAIGRRDLLALTINSVVGAAVYGLPATVAGIVGAYSVPAVAASAVVIGLVVLCFAEVASRFDSTGGPYLYARAAFGETTGFVTGWLLLVARVTGSAALCGLLAKYLAYFAPATTAGIGRLVVIALVLLTLAAIHVRGIGVAATVSNAVTAAKLVPILALVVVGAFAVSPERLVLGPPPSASDFGSAVLLLCFAFSGFETVTIAAGETRDPRRDVPFVLGVGLTAVALLYLAVQAVCVGAVPGLATVERPLAEAGRYVFGDAVVPVVVVGGAVAIAGTLHTALLAASRLVYAMADGGELPRAMSGVHARYRTPAWAICAVVVVVGVLASVSTFQGALTISTAARLVVYGVTCAALPVLRRRPDAPPARLRLPAAPVAWVGGLVLVAAVLAGVTRAQGLILVVALAMGVGVRSAVRAGAGRRASGGMPPRAAGTG